MKANTPTLYLMTVTALICLLTAPARADGIDRLLGQSGLTQQVNEFPAQVKAGFMQGIQQGGPIPDGVLAALSDSIDNSIAPAVILDEIRTSIKQAVSDDEVATLLDWYSSDIGKKITAAEAEASKPESYQYIMNNATQLLSDTRRVEMAHKLDALIGATDMAMDIQEFSGQAVYTAIMTAMVPEQKVDLSGYKAQMAAIEPQARESIRQLIAASFVYTYRNLDDSTLNQYMDYLSRPLTRRFNDAAIAGLNKGFETVVTRWADEVAAILKTAIAQQSAATP